MRITSLCLVFLLNMVLSSCSDKGEGIATPIRSSTWLLQSIQIGGQTTIIPSNEVYTLHFENDTLVTGQVHCNTYWTDYHLVSPDSISFGPFNVTKIGCPLPPTRDEFRLAFDNANSLNVAGPQLRLYYLNRTRVLNFEKEM
jgi:heat shock protein HslJ